MYVVGRFVLSPPTCLKMMTFSHASDWPCPVIFITIGGLLDFLFAFFVFLRMLLLIESTCKKTPFF